MKEKIKHIARNLWKSKTAYLFLLPLMIGIICFCYYPPIMAIIRSFTNWEVGKLNEEVVFSFDNYKQLFSDPVFLKSISTMLYINIPKMIIGIVAPLAMAELIYWVSNKKLSATYRVLILLPMITPGVIGTYIWTYIYKIDGILNKLLGIFHINSEISWLNNADTVIPAIIFMGFPWVGGTNVLIYLSGLMNIPTELSEAARLDGATTIQIIFKIHLPSIVGQIRYFFVFGIIGAFQDYGIQVVLDNSGLISKDIVNSAIMVPGYYMYVQAFSNGNMGYACAIGTLLFLTVLIITVITFKAINAQKFDLD